MTIKYAQNPAYSMYFQRPIFFSSHATVSLKTPSRFPDSTGVEFPPNGLHPLSRTHTRTRQRNSGSQEFYTTLCFLHTASFLNKYTFLHTNSNFLKQFKILCKLFKGKVKPN